MYHIVKDVASLITTSSEHHCLTALSQRASHFLTGRVYTSKLDQLPCFNFLRDIVNIAKIYRQYSRDVRGWCSDKKEGIFRSVDPFKEKTNQHRTRHLDPPRAGLMFKPNIINVMVVRNCMNISKYTLIGYKSLLNGGW